MHFNHFAILLFVATAAVACIVSKFFPPPGLEQLDGKTIWSTSGRKYGEFEDEETLQGGAEAAQGTKESQMVVKPAVLGHGTAGGADPPLPVVAIQDSVVKECVCRDETLQV